VYLNALGVTTFNAFWKRALGMAKKEQLYFFADGEKVPLVAVTDLVAHGKADSDSMPSVVTFAKRILNEPTKGSQIRGLKRVETEYPIYFSKAGGVCRRVTRGSRSGTVAQPQ